MNFFRRNLSVPFKKCQNFKAQNKLKELILSKISCIPNITRQLILKVDKSYGTNEKV